MRRTAPWLICLFSLLCATIAVSAYLRSRAQIHLLENEVKDLTERTRRLQTQLLSAEKARDVAQRSARALEVGIDSGGKKLSPTTIINVMDYGAMFRDPAYKPLWRRIESRNERRSYWTRIAAMNLSPEQTATLWGLLLERIESQMDSNDASQQANLSSEDTQKAWREAQGEINEQIKALIGQDNFTLLQTPTITQIDYSVGKDFGVAGCPLSPEQTALLGQAFNEAHLSPFGAGNSNNQATDPPDPQTGLTPNYQALLDRVAPRLTPAQVSVFKDYALEQVQLQQYAKESAKHRP